MENRKKAKTTKATFDGWIAEVFRFSFYSCVTPVYILCIEIQMQQYTRSFLLLFLDEYKNSKQANVDTTIGKILSHCMDNAGHAYMEYG